jgi:hypothetical protein
MILGNPRPKPTNLAEWLEQAVGGLVPSAQGRLRAEISAHYAEAEQAHLQAGSTADAAQAAALADLGDAPAAARRFGREYVTIEDLSLVDRWTGPFKIKPFGTVFWMLMIFGVLTPDMFNANVLEAVAWEWVAILFLVGIIVRSLRALVRTGRRTRLQAGRQAILWMSLAWLLFGALWITNYTVLRPLQEPLANWGFAVAMMACAISLSLHYLRLRKKLATADENDLPPREPDAKNSIPVEAA